MHGIYCWFRSCLLQQLSCKHWRVPSNLHYTNVVDVQSCTFKLPQNHNNSVEDSLMLPIISSWIHNTDKDLQSKIHHIFDLKFFCWLWYNECLFYTMTFSKKSKRNQIYSPSFIAFINKVIYIFKWSDSKFSQVFYIWPQHWMFPKELIIPVNFNL